MPKVVPIKPPHDPEAVYFHAWRVGDSPLTVIYENVTAHDVLAIWKELTKIVNYLTGESGEPE